MDALAIVESELAFVQSFYDRAAAPFLLTLHQIEHHLDPFPTIDYQSGEPEYDTEWSDARKSLNLLGGCVLALVEVVFKGYCKQFFLEAIENWETLVKKQKGSSWFAKYKSTFGSFGIDWDASGADLALVEQVFVTRNDTMHQDSLWMLGAILQSKSHFEKYPDSAFANPIDLVAMTDENGEQVGPLHIEINRDHIAQSIAEITTLCRYIEANPDGQALRFSGA
jgi:hypothetical protein